MKQITTGTEITFKKTKAIFELTQTETGFDVRESKFSKNIPAENWSFQELLDQYEAGKITIDGFEETDASHVRALLTGYIYEAKMKSLLTENQTLKSENEELKSENKLLKQQTEELKTENEALSTAKELLS